MAPANDTRVPVAVTDVFQLLCPLAVFAAAARLPANEVLVQGIPAVETLFGAYNAGVRVLVATVVCTLLALIQLAVIRDPARGTPRRRWGIAVATLGVVAGLVVAHGAYQIGFQPAGDYYETLPRAGAYVGLFAGVGFASLAIVRLTRFFEAEPAPPSAAPPATP